MAEFFSIKIFLFGFQILHIRKDSKIHLIQPPNWPILSMVPMPASNRFNELW